MENKSHNFPLLFFMRSLILAPLNPRPGENKDIASNIFVFPTPLGPEK